MGKRRSHAGQPSMWVASTDLPAECGPPISTATIECAVWPRRGGAGSRFRGPFAGQLVFNGAPYGTGIEELGGRRRSVQSKYRWKSRLCSLGTSTLRSGRWTPLDGRMASSGRLDCACSVSRQSSMRSSMTDDTAEDHAGRREAPLGQNVVNETTVRRRGTVAVFERVNVDKRRTRRRRPAAR